MSEKEEIQAATYFEPWLSEMAFGQVTDNYCCPRCKRTQMPRRISFDYVAMVGWDDVPVFTRLFCTRCVEDESTDDEYRMHWYVERVKTESEKQAVLDAPWRGYGALLGF